MMCHPVYFVDKEGERVCGCHVWKPPSHNERGSPSLGKEDRDDGGNWGDAASEHNWH